LENLEAFAQKLDARSMSGEQYRSSLHGKLKFMSVDNGDVIAFDLTATGEPPVVYWDHETEEVTYLAPTFHDFIDHITMLKCIGNELWQYAPFLTNEGLDAKGEVAKKWRNWFQAFLTSNLHS
jgi:hypothetical protein